jgi:hypothetical protein
MIFIIEQLSIIRLQRKMWIDRKTKKLTLNFASQNWTLICRWTFQSCGAVVDIFQTTMLLNRKNSRNKQIKCLWNSLHNRWKKFSLLLCYSITCNSAFIFCKILSIMLWMLLNEHRLLSIATFKSMTWVRRQYIEIFNMVLNVWMDI